MKVLFAAVAVMAAMVGSGASALDPVHLKRLKVTNECKGCELSSANLVKANLRFADLSGANLSGADLSLALINGAILCNTTMPDGSVLYSGC